MKEQKRIYEAPQLTQFRCRVEKGYTTSADSNMLGLGNQSQGSSTLEGRRNGGNWGGGSGSEPIFY